MLGKKAKLSAKWTCAETYFLIRFLRHALWTQKSQNFLRRQEPHPLRRSILAACILQKAFTASSVISQQSLSAPQPSLQRSGRDPGGNLSDLSSHWEDRYYSTTETEREFASPVMFARVSSSISPA